MNDLYKVGCSLEDAIYQTVSQAATGTAFSRKSPLSMPVIIRLLIGAEGGSLDKILYAAKIEASASAVTQRRNQISPDVFREVFDRFNSANMDNNFYRDYRLLAVDGTAVNLPRNPKAESFVRHDGIPRGSTNCI